VPSQPQMPPSIALTPGHPVKVQLLLLKNGNKESVLTSDLFSPIYPPITVIHAALDKDLD